MDEEDGECFEVKVMHEDCPYETEPWRVEDKNPTTTCVSACGVLMSADPREMTCRYHEYCELEYIDVSG